MEVEPGHSLQEGLLLGELVLRLAQVRADGESVHNATEEVDLIRLTGLDQDVLRLVTELTGENAVGLCKATSASDLCETAGKTAGRVTHLRQRWRKASQWR